MLSLTEILNPRPGWYRGDFHAHTDFSDGVLPPPRLAALARAEGLDFFAITDHNTLKAYPHFDGDGRLLIIPGIEVTFKEGHFNVFGIDRDLDWLQHVCTGQIALSALPAAYATVNDLLRAIAAHGLLISVNHPLLAPWAWRFQDTDLALVHCLEIWNDPSYPDNVRDNPRAVELWTSRLNAGQRLTAIGGSDFHRPLPKPGENKPAERLSRPSTYVYAENLSGAAILDGLRRHKVIVSMGPEVTFQAKFDGRTYEIGDEIPDSNTSRSVETDAEAPNSSSSRTPELADKSAAPRGLITLTATVSRCQLAARARIVRNGEIIAQEPVRDGAVTLTLEDTLPPGFTGWYRLDVVEPSGLIQAISNPIYIGPARPPQSSTIPDFAAALR